MLKNLDTTVCKSPVKTFFITKCDKKTSHTFLGFFEKKFTMCEKKRKIHEFQINFYKVLRKLLQSATGITKLDKIY